MPPRRKKAAKEETPAQPEDGTPDASSEAQPKKRAARASKPVVSKPPEPQWPPAPRIPTIIPIKSAPAIPPRPTTVADTPAPRITIEPEIHIGEVEEAWTPSPRKGVDLSVPPMPLMQSKKFPNQDIEDIMAGDDDEDEVSDRNCFRPPVRTGAYRKIALGFAVLALLVGTGVAYVVYAHATIVVYPQKAEVKTERVLTVTPDPKGVDEIPGEISEVTVAGEKTEAPSGSTKSDAIAKGFATLINESANDQTLVATTRLLAPDGTLFRIKSRVNVPANGRIKTEVYADKAGESGNLAPTTFTIPGLNATLQKVIYGESSAAMTGGIVTVGTVSSEDIDKTEAALRQELIAQARQELAKKDGTPWTGHAMLAETMNRSVNAGPGETADGVTVRLTLRIRTVDFDRAKAVDASAEDLQRSLTSDRELTGVKVDDSSFTIDKADPKSRTASLRVALTGLSRVSLESPLFDASKLRGQGLDDVRTYFESIEGVERVDVKFRPFWLKRMPLLPDQIEFQIEK